MLGGFNARVGSRTSGHDWSVNVRALTDWKRPMMLEKSFRNVSQFPYLGSTTQSSGRAEVDVGRRLAQASKAFRASRKAVFGNKDLTLKTKRAIYQACVLSVLLYRSECWTPLRRDLRRLNAFHHRCVHNVLGISRRQQWTQHITSWELRQRWGDP